jgi:Macrocin-O-methyltransferase (TylF)
MSIKDYVKHAVCYPLRVSVKDIQGERQRQALLETVAFVEKQMSHVPSFRNRFKLMEYALRQRDVPGGLICEFGVHRGESINRLARWMPDVEIHGFDSFEGLPEGWQADIAKGAFAINGIPKVASNVTLHKGWFDTTLPEFKKGHNRPIAFMHADADLYTSTKSIFDVLGDQIVSGTVIQFDEYFNYPSWQQHEHRAFSEFCAERAVQFKYLGFAGSAEQVAVKITSTSLRSP